MRTFARFCSRLVSPTLLYASERAFIDVLAANPNSEPIGRTSSTSFLDRLPEPELEAVGLVAASE